ncbi:MAG: VWA domain-containing protein [Planctomycetota bacterium]|jgi:Ca-activated chloride channel family protein
MRLHLALQEITRSTATGRLEVGGVTFADPWFLVLIPVSALLLWRGRESRRQVGARVPGLGPAAAGRRSTLSWLPVALRIAGVSLLAVALSRPLEGRVSTARETEGIDIALLLDRSSSMDQRARPGAPRRFDIVTEVIADFARRRMTDEEGARDNVGLFGFAGFADLLVPFTLDVDALTSVLDETDIETEQRLDGTAIGSALAQACEVLSQSEARSRVAVLLTDGEETIHVIEPLEAAEVASELGIRVYTVYAGPRVQLIQMPLGGARRVQADVGELPRIAELTGGRFFHAESREELEAAYSAIEELERTPRSEERFAERYDLYPMLLGPALLLLALASLTGATVARRVP